MMWTPQKDADGRFHFSQREYYTTRELFGFVSALEEWSNVLERRLREIPGGWRDYRLMTTISRKLLVSILKTVPRKKLALIRKELENIEILVNVRNNVSPKSEDEKYGFTYVPNAAIERITQRVVDFECMGCEKKGADAKHCQLRKDIEATYMFAYPCPDKKQCPFQGMIFGSEYGLAEEYEETQTDDDGGKTCSI